MSVMIIVGGQYGSEGKGKVAKFFARRMGATMSVRCGGPNSGHTVVVSKNGKPVSYCFRHLPSSCMDSGAMNIIPPGAFINKDVLLDEIKFSGLMPGRLVIDSRVTLVTSEHMRDERLSGLRDKIGSTCAGMGSAILEKIARMRQLPRVEDDPDLGCFVGDTIPMVNCESKEGMVIVEGAQGFGLSIIHGEYPYTTSRDTTAASFAVDAGIPIKYITDVVVVIRSYPIRVGGNSGPMKNEISWDILRERLCRDIEPELSSVTKRQRRIAEFDADLVNRAIVMNASDRTRIVLNHVDYLSGTEDIFQDIERVRDGVNRIQESLCHEIEYIGCGENDTLGIDSFSLW